MRSGTGSTARSARERPCGVVAAAALGSVVLLASSPSWAAQMTDRIIAVVNTEVITLSELKAEVAPEEKRLLQAVEKQTTTACDALKNAPATRRACVGPHRCAGRSTPPRSATPRCLGCKNA